MKLSRRLSLARRANLRVVGASHTLPVQDLCYRQSAKEQIYEMRDAEHSARAATREPDVSPGEDFGWLEGRGAPWTDLNPRGENDAGGGQAELSALRRRGPRSMHIPGARRELAER